MDEKAKEKLFNDLIKAKKAEDQAKDKRIELEEEIAELYKDQVEGKSKTFNEEIGKSKFKITLKKSILQTLDQDAYLKIRPQIPEDRRPEKVKFSIDSAGYEWLKENDRENFIKVSNCVSEKEGKTSITIEKK